MKAKQRKARFVAALRGLVNPPIVRLTRPRRYELGRSLVISGFPRSGTTWLAELLSSLPGAAILFEPLNPVRVKAAQEAGCDWQNFRTRGESWLEGEKFVRDILAGRVINRWTTCYTSIPSAWNVSRWIVKLVNSNAMLPWLVDHFDVPAPVLLIRHPCAVYASWVRRGWPLLSHPPFLGSRFYDAYPEFVPVVRRLARQEEWFAAAWCLDHYPALRELHASEYDLCYYERLVVDGEAELGRLFGRWQLELPPDVVARIHRPSAKASDDLRAGSVAQLGAWRRHLDRSVVARMIDVLRQFGFEMYGPDPEPDVSAPLLTRHSDPRQP